MRVLLFVFCLHAVLALSSVQAASVNVTQRIFTFDTISFDGNNIAVIPQSSYDGCSLACTRTPSCVAFTFVRTNSTCITKSAIGSYGPSNGLVGMAGAESAIIVPTHLQDGQKSNTNKNPTGRKIAVANDGVDDAYSRFQVASLRGVDLFGGDIPNGYGRTVSEDACFGACAQTSGCIAYSYLTDKDPNYPNTCWLKQAVMQPRFRGQVAMAGILLPIAVQTK
jgi:hypothetical protein